MAEIPKDCPLETGVMEVGVGSSRFRGTTFQLVMLAVLLLPIGVAVAANYFLDQHEQASQRREQQTAQNYKDLTGAIQLWIEVGEPDEKRVRKACGQADEVVVYGYGGAGTDAWRASLAPLATRNNKLTVRRIAREHSRSMAALAARNMTLTYTVQESRVWLSDGARDVQLDLG